MKYTKEQIQEIVDADGELIGSMDVPQTGANLDTAANNTTDYNASIGHQPYRYDMLGRFGFTLLPFFEGEEKKGELNQGQAELENDLVDLMNERYIDLLSHYYRNPKTVQSDYRKYSKEEEVSEEAMKYSVEWADKILKIVEKHFGNAFDKLENLDENAFVEGKMLDKKDEVDVVKKSDDNEVTSKQIEKIAGLLNNKFDKEEVNKLITLLETE